jgi:hypothetical protein
MTVISMSRMEIDRVVRRSGKRNTAPAVVSKWVSNTGAARLSELIKALSSVIDPSLLVGRGTDDQPTGFFFKKYPRAVPLL